MGMSVKVIIYLMTISASLWSVTENKGRSVHDESDRPSNSLPPSICEAKTEDQDEPKDKNDQNVVITIVVVCLAVILVLAGVLLFLFRHKLPRTQVCCASGGSSEERANSGHNTEGNHGDHHHYEETQMGNQQQSSGGAMPSVYATVNPPADQLHYASVNFQKDSVTVSTDGNVLPDTNKDGSLACDYSSISKTQDANHPPAAEQTLYSTVAKPGEP